MKNIRIFYLKIFVFFFFFFFFFFCGKIFSIFEWTCFRNVNDAEPNKIKKKYLLIWIKHFDFLQSEIINS